VPIKKELLDILCCPITKVAVEQLAADKIEKVNELIESGQAKYVDGSEIKEPLKEALITIDKKTIYRVDEDIPVMLADQGIPAEQFKEF